MLDILIGIICAFFLIRYMSQKYELHGPNSRDIVDIIYVDNKKCGKLYRMIPEIQPCPNKQKPLR